MKKLLSLLVSCVSFAALSGVAQNTTSIPTPVSNPGGTPLPFSATLTDNRPTITASIKGVVIYPGTNSFVIFSNSGPGTVESIHMSCLAGYNQPWSWAGCLFTICADGLTNTATLSGLFGGWGNPTNIYTGKLVWQGYGTAAAGGTVTRTFDINAWTNCWIAISPPSNSVNFGLFSDVTYAVGTPQRTYRKNIWHCNEINVVTNESPSYFPTMFTSTGSSPGQLEFWHLAIFGTNSAQGNLLFEESPPFLLTDYTNLILSSYALSGSTNRMQYLGNGLEDSFGTGNYGMDGSALFANERVGWRSTVATSAYGSGGATNVCDMVAFTNTANGPYVAAISAYRWLPEFSWNTNGSLGYIVGNDSYFGTTNYLNIHSCISWFTQK